MSLFRIQEENQVLTDKRKSVSRTIVTNSLPVFLSIVLFILLIFLIILPFIKEALLNQKKDAVRKMVESAYSLVDKAYEEYLSGESTEEESQEKILSILNALRYDEGMRNYFWINTIEEGDVSLLIMHPYRQDLVGSNVLYLQDPYGVYLFRDMIGLVEVEGEGYLSYHWQYMDDIRRIEPKLSFIKLFQPWNWIIGTGLYLDDINREINQITGDITRYILLVLFLIILLLAYNSYRTMITEREKNTARKKLYDSQRYLSSLFDLLPLALFSCDERWAVQNCNVRALSLLNESRESILESPLYALIPETKTITDRIDLQPERGGEEHFEKFGICVDGRDLIVNITVIAVQLENVPEFVILIDDVSTQVQREKQLIQAQKMETVGTLVGGIAHDFNNILGGIIGASSLIGNKCDHFESLTGDELRSYLSLIDEAGSRAADMVQQLLSLSRKQETQFSARDLNVCLRDTHKICSNSFNKCIEIHLRTWDSPAMAMINFTMIEQVLLNLCINASHAMTIMREEPEAAGGTLTLQLDKVVFDDDYHRYNPEAGENEYWCIVVQDTGIGIEKKNLTRIFEPFFSTKDKDHGSGLGLSMAYNIIRQHKGFIDVNSETGQGTAVKVFLPVLDAETEHKPDDLKDGPPVEGRGTVLVVDDDDIIRQLAVEILKNCGYNTLEAPDGEEGIRVFRENKDRIDLIYLDMIMPRKSGEQVFRAVRKIDRSVRILLSSGFKKDEKVKGLLDQGVDGFLQKPFSAYELSRQVHELLTRDPENG